MSILKILSFPFRHTPICNLHHPKYHKHHLYIVFKEQELVYQAFFEPPDSRKWCLAFYFNSESSEAIFSLSTRLHNLPKENK